MLHNYKKYLRALSAILLIFATLIGAQFCMASEAPKHRYVVLVYDDSGSMSEKKSTDWEKANYSLQSLAALLDSGDKLFVVRMSEPGSPKEISLDASRQQAINQIRNTPNANQNTPFETIRTAAAFLERAPRNYQRWLVISSDGRFQAGKNDITAAEFSNYLEDYRNRGENSDINMLFVAIGSQVPTDLKAAWQQTVGQPPLNARDSREIIARMNEISALITSRDPLHPQDENLNVKYDGVNKVHLTSPFPLRRLTILRQSSSDAPLAIQSIKVNNRVIQLQVSGPFVAGTPVGGTEKVSGRIMHIGTGQTEIPAGAYTLTFGQNVANERGNIKFLAETAIDFRCGFYKRQGGKIVKVTDANAAAGDEVEARVEIWSAAGTQPLKLAGIRKLVEVKADIGARRGIPLQADLARNCFTVKGIKLEPGRTNAHFTMTIRGWYKGSKNIRLDVKNFPPRNLGLTVDPPDWNHPVDKLKLASPLTLTPTVDGRPMTKEEFAEIKNNLIVSSPNLKIDVEQGQQAFKLYPRPSRWGVAFTDTGQFTVNTVLQGRVLGEQTETNFRVTIEDIPWYKKYGPLIVWPTTIILLLIYLYGIYKKPRFSSRSSYVDHKRETPSYDWEYTNSRAERLYSSWAKRYLVPFTPETVQIGSIKFIATGNVWSIKISKDSLADLLKDEETRVRLAGSSITPEDLGVDMVMGRGDELLIQKPGRQEWFNYPNSDNEL